MKLSGVVPPSLHHALAPLSSPPHTCNDIELCPHSTLPTDVVVSLVLSLVHAVNYFIDLHLRGRGRGGGWGNKINMAPSDNTTIYNQLNGMLHLCLH